MLLPKLEPLPRKVFRLRWVMHYNNRRSKIGVWDCASDFENDSAWRQPKDGLTAVVIEGEDIHGNIKILLDCPASEYASMQWESYARVPALFKGNGGVARGNIAGLSIITREEKITIFCNGKFDRQPLTDHDKLFKIKEFSV